MRPELAAWRWLDRPATTVAGDPRITAREHHYHGQQSKTSLRLTLEEAAILQTFPMGGEVIRKVNTMSEIVALDLFAGTGWGVACQRLGIKEKGVEIMPEAVATREANGMTTVYRDVWDGLLLSREVHEACYGSYSLLIASPPCQTFSMAGNGAGRRALDDVLSAIESGMHEQPDQLRSLAHVLDPRTALVLTPLAYVYRDRPTYVALEQVPTVLPVWEAYAKVMREWGYSVDVAVLSAEQYGVPQTRKRAILVARLDDIAMLPKPTHSRYYPTKPEKLDEGVLKWVSMAEALGWGRTVPSPTYCNSGNGGAGIEWGGNSVRKAMREQSLTGNGWVRKPDVEPGTNDAIRVTVEDAAVLQSYPMAVKNMGKGMVERHGDRPGRAGDQPAFTIRASAGGTEPGGFVLQDSDGQTRKLEVEEAAVLQSYPTGLRSNYGTGGDASKRGQRTIDQPAPTLTSKADRNKWDGAQQMTIEEAATLQTYEPPFVWCGAKTKQYLQIGNAVPPLLAEAVLTALTGETL